MPPSTERSPGRTPGRRLAALGAVSLVSCSFGGAAQRPAPPPTRAAVVAGLETLDGAGTGFHLVTSVTGGGSSEKVEADGHVKRGDVQMTATSAGSTVSLEIVDGVLYGAPAGSSRWLDMSADPATFLWPAARPSLVWESVLLSPSPAAAFKLRPDQLILLAGALASATPDAFARGSHGEVRVRMAAARILGWEVVVAGPGGIRLDSVLTVTGADPADITAPSGATPGSVPGLLFTGGGTVA